MLNPCTPGKGGKAVPYMLAFRNAPRASVGPVHAATARIIGAVFLLAGTGLLIFGLVR